MQEHTPMTEDMLWEQATVLAKLGTSEEAARVRAKMQSSSLLSDMQAFKASTIHDMI
jgi:Rab3 GTPase-activating protein catalytic subunit